MTSDKKKEADLTGPVTLVIRSTGYQPECGGGGLLRRLGRPRRAQRLLLLL